MTDETETAPPPAKDVCFILATATVPSKYFYASGRFGDDPTVALRFASKAAAENHATYLGMPATVEEYEI